MRILSFCGPATASGAYAFRGAMPWCVFVWRAFLLLFQQRRYVCDHCLGVKLELFLVSPCYQKIAAVCKEDK